MRLALSGAGGVGKTTLVEAVHRELRIPIISEFARETAQEIGVVNLRKMTPEQTLDFQTRILKKKVESESVFPTFIADRSTADNVAYYLRWCSRDLNDKINKEYVDKCIAHLKTYDMVILLDWNAIPLVDDGFRSGHRYYQYEIHCLIRGILEDNNIKYIVLSEPNLEKRIKFVKNLILNFVHDREVKAEIQELIDSDD